MYPPTIQKLIELFSDFPGVGPRTAARFVFYLLHQKQEKVGELIGAISELKNKVKICNFCFNPFEEVSPRLSLCPICSNPTRDKNLLCVVENETDLSTIEKIKKYKGLYFVLGGTISTLKEKESVRRRIEALHERIKNPKKFGVGGGGFQEIIIATNATADGETTALHLMRILKSPDKKITRLGRGLPSGSELEYADEETLSAAFESRR